MQKTMQDSERDRVKTFTEEMTDLEMELEMLGVGAPKQSLFSARKSRQESGVTGQALLPQIDTAPGSQPLNIELVEGKNTASDPQPSDQEIVNKDEKTEEPKISAPDTQSKDHAPTDAPEAPKNESMATKRETHYQVVEDFIKDFSPREGMPHHSKEDIIKTVQENLLEAPADPTLVERLVECAKSHPKPCNSAMVCIEFVQACKDVNKILLMKDVLVAQYILNKAILVNFHDAVSCTVDIRDNTMCNE